MFAQQRSQLPTYFSESIPIIKQSMNVEQGRESIAKISYLYTVMGVFFTEIARKVIFTCAQAKPTDSALFEFFS